MIKLLTRVSHKINITNLAERNHLISIMYLSPAKVSGKNVCPFASDCKAPCLATSGRMIMSPIQNTMLCRTKMFWNDRKTFKTLLFKELSTHIKRAKRLNRFPTIRLNGTSDIAWEIVFPNLFTIHSSIQFYDYTKFPYWKRANLPSNYYLLRSHHEGNNHETKQILKRGNLAVCFDTKKAQPLPQTWRGYPVIDGDLSDLRFKDKAKSGIVVGLRAKGKARMLKTTPSSFLQSGNYK